VLKNEKLLVRFNYQKSISFNNVSTRILNSCENVQYNECLRMKYCFTSRDVIFATSWVDTHRMKRSFVQGAIMAPNEGFEIFNASLGYLSSHSVGMLLHFQMASMSERGWIYRQIRKVLFPHKGIFWFVLRINKTTMTSMWNWLPLYLQSICLIMSSRCIFEQNWRPLLNINFHHKHIMTLL